MKNLLLTALLIGGFNTAYAELQFPTTEAEIVQALTPKPIRQKFKGGALSHAKIEIVGHTDNAGTESYNLDLSERRALAIKAFLVSA